MKTHLFIMYLLLCSCNNLINTYELSNVIKYDLLLNKEDFETLKVNWEPALNTDWKFEDSTILCIIENDTLKLSCSEGLGPNIQLKIDINKTKYSTKINVSNCTYNQNKNIIKNSLILNKSTYLEGDTIIGKLHIETEDSTIISGKFKIKIRNQSFNLDSLYCENKQKKIKKLISNSESNKIRTLDLSNTGTLSLFIELNKLKSIEEIDLSENELSNFNFKQLKQLSNLKILRFNHCNLKIIPKEILELGQLKELELWDNNLKSIPIELFNLHNLKVLNLGYNKIELIPDEIKNLKKIETLDLSWNPIYTLPKSIYYLNNLLDFQPPSRLENHSEVVNKIEFTEILDSIRNK